MAEREFKFHDGEKGAALAVRVKFSRGKSSFAKVLKDGTVVVQLEHGGGDMNAMLIDFISQQLDIPSARIQVIAGEDGQNKLISIIDMKPKQVQKLILDTIS